MRVHVHAGMCKFVHAWVLVLPGKRDITEAVFIEPSTGRKYPLTGGHSNSLLLVAASQTLIQR
jgi:hypothetical protein